MRGKAADFSRERNISELPGVVNLAAVIVAHNHPSGNVEPSAEDRDVTARLNVYGHKRGADRLRR
jgi:DNA repair protein RadC